MGKRQSDFASPTASKGKKVSSPSVPDVPTLGELFVGRALKANAASVGKDLEVTVLPYCSDGSAYAPMFSKPLVVVQVMHGEKPNCLYMLHQVMNRFCQAMQLLD